MATRAKQNPKKVGIPDDREQYIHRVGRTARAGKEGRAWLLLAPYERPFLKELSSSGVECGEDRELAALLTASSRKGPSHEPLDEALASIARAAKLAQRNPAGKGSGAAATELPPLAKSAENAYRAWLGFYLGQRKRTGSPSREEVVDRANAFGALCGLDPPPTLLKKTVGKMGLKGVRGLRVQ